MTIRKILTRRKGRKQQVQKAQVKRTDFVVVVESEPDAILSAERIQLSEAMRRSLSTGVKSLGN